MTTDQQQPDSGELARCGLNYTVSGGSILQHKPDAVTWPCGNLALIDSLRAQIEALEPYRDVGWEVIETELRAELADMQRQHEPISDTYACQACGRRDGLDTVLPDAVWEQLRQGDNLLCLWCLDQRAAAAGLPFTRVTLHFAGLSLHGTSQSTTDQEHIARLATKLDEAWAEVERLKEEVMTWQARAEGW